MRNKFLSLGVVLASLGLFPAAAQAHHLDQDTSTLACVLVANVPTVQTSARYVDFSPWDQPVFWSESIDKVTVGGGSLSWTGPDYVHSVSFATTAGNHDVVYQAAWNSGENGGYLSRRGLVCPAPIPPQPTPTPTPPPVVVYYDCTGHQLPAGSAPATCPPTKPPCSCTPPPKPKAHCPVIHLVMPTARHGVHDFGGRCSKGKIIDTTLYITATGPRGGDMRHGRRIVCGTAKLHAKGAIIHGVWLYDQTVFCHRQAWGSYSLIFVFHVRIHGHVYRCVKRAHFFNHDPGGYPDTLAHAARSAWGQSA
jgi:hypothetical protein